MARLVHRTRGQSNPKGKPRVYFACHPGDFEGYFPSISEELLEKQDCVIWYDEEPKAVYDEEEWLSDLSQMQLFVIPVTMRFLTEPNRAIELEIPYAMAHHIPVLPLIQEEGLEELFNRRCGELQCLNKNQQDATAIHYEEKLEKFLNSVLVGDELARKVRAAFDAYIFLSYRKKDRRYAQELMRLIHKNDFCRDIAIWYDEFLTPGENFNDAIKKALEKSELFALAITPNLVNETNYVMNIEYPMAKRVEKTILAVEMVETDKEELKKNYEGIPECADAHDEVGLSKKLMDTVAKMAIVGNDSSPEHNFFIGLAYLGGIDVEVDRGKAFELIESSAEAGLMEAIEKLCAMYRNGEGVERDYERAILWQKRLVEIWKKIYEKSGSLKDAKKLIMEIWALWEYSAMGQNMSEAKAASRQMKKTCEELLETTEDSDIRHYLSISCNMLASVARVEGRLEEAEILYRKKLDIDLCNYKEGKNIEKSDLVMSYMGVGGICKRQGKIKEAKECYERGIQFSKMEEEEGDAELARRHMSHCYRHLGELAEKEAKWKEAYSYYQMALEICRNTYKEKKTARAKNNIVDCWVPIVGIIELTGRLEEAEKYCRNILKSRLEVYEELETYGVLSSVGSDYIRLGDICEKREKDEEAVECYRKSLEINQKLYEKTKMRVHYDGMAVAYYKLGYIAEETGEEMMKRAYQIWEELSRISGDPVFAQKRDLAKENLEMMNLDDCL